MNIIDFQTAPWNGFSTLTAPQHYHSTFRAALECEERLKIAELSRIYNSTDKGKYLIP